MVPVTAVPLRVIVTVLLLIVDEFIASLKTTLMTLLVLTDVSLEEGEVEETDGAVVSSGAWWEMRLWGWFL